MLRLRRYSCSPPENWFVQPSSLYPDWHTYSVLWTQTNVKFYLDEQLVASVSPLDSTNQPQFIILWNECCGWDVGVSSQTADDMDTQVDWVRGVAAVVWLSPLIEQAF